MSFPSQLANCIAKEAKNTPSGFIKKLLKALMLWLLLKPFHKHYHGLFERILQQYLSDHLSFEGAETERIADVELPEMFDFKTSYNVIFNEAGNRLPKSSLLRKLCDIVEEELDEGYGNVGAIIIGVEENTRNVIGYKRNMISQEFVRIAENQLKTCSEKHRFRLIDIEVLNTEKNILTILYKREDPIDPDSAENLSGLF